MEKTKELNKEILWLIVMNLRPFEVIKIKKDEFGKPNRVIVMTESTTILDSLEEKK